MHVAPLEIEWIQVKLAFSCNFREPPFFYWLSSNMNGHFLGLVAPPHPCFEPPSILSLNSFDVPASNLRNTLFPVTESEDQVVYFHTGNNLSIPQIRLSSKHVTTFDTKLTGHLFACSKDGRILVICNERNMQILQAAYYLCI